jgi:ubiquinone/menaquinone biosynthesis C-methylase UbiE
MIARQARSGTEHLPETEANPDDLPAFYDSRYSGDYMSAAQPEDEVARVRDVLGDVPGPVHSVLDYGCGSGAWIETLSATFPGARITGLEISRRAIDAAERRFPDVGFVPFDGTRAPLPDAAFDLVFSHHVLEHVADLDATVADMVRLARPGGWICACLPCANPGSLEEWVTRQTRDGVQVTPRGETRFFNEEPSHLRSLRSAELAGLFARHGATLAAESYLHPLAAIGYYARHRWEIPVVFDHRQARDARARRKLVALSRSLRAVGKVVSLAERRPPEGSPRAPIASTAARPVSALVGTHLPRLEWRVRRRRPDRAAAQYLVFRRAAATAGA